jgi:hypothetical protein
MLFRARYSQEMLEQLKSLIHEESILKKITGFISDDKWIYFEPVAVYKVSNKKIRSVLPGKIKPVRGEGLKTHSLFSFVQETLPAGYQPSVVQCTEREQPVKPEATQEKPRQPKRHCHLLQQ